MVSTRTPLISRTKREKERDRENGGKEGKREKGGREAAKIGQEGEMGQKWRGKVTQKVGRAMAKGNRKRILKINTYKKN